MIDEYEGYEGSETTLEYEGYGDSETTLEYLIDVEWLNTQLKLLGSFKVDTSDDY